MKISKYINDYAKRNHIHSLEFSQYDVQVICEHVASVISKEGKEKAWKAWQEAESFDLSMFSLADKPTKVTWDGCKERFEKWWIKNK